MSGQELSPGCPGLIWSSRPRAEFFGRHSGQMWPFHALKGAFLLLEK